MKQRLIQPTQHREREGEGEDHRIGGTEEGRSAGED